MTNQLAKYLGQRSFSSKVTVGTHTHRHTHRIQTIAEHGARFSKYLRINLGKT